jgi:hypothetical protein
MGFILLTHKYLKQFAMKEPYTDSLVRVRVKDHQQVHRQDLYSGRNNYSGYFVKVC